MGAVMAKTRFHLLATLALLAGLSQGTPAAFAARLSDSEIADRSNAVVYAVGREQIRALDALAARGNPDVAATLILAMRYGGSTGNDAVARAFKAVTGSAADNWFDAMLWQEAHPWRLTSLDAEEEPVPRDPQQSRHSTSLPPPAA